MPAYHSSFNENVKTVAGNMAVLPIRTNFKGPAPKSTDGDGIDIIDEALLYFKPNIFFREYEIKGPADRTLIYLTLYITECLKRLSKGQTKMQANKDLTVMALESKLPIPGESSFPFAGLYKPPANAGEEDLMRTYLQQLRQEIGARLIELIYQLDDKHPSKRFNALILTLTMSRIIIKNLPAKVTQNEIRKHFNEFEPITDVKLKYTPEGQFRKIAFVGFASDGNAERAIKKFDRTFIKASRIMVQNCNRMVVNDENRQKIIESIVDTGRLFLRNLSYLCTESDLIAAFQPYGTLNEVSCIVNRQGACKGLMFNVEKSLGFALITFMFPNDAVNAYEEMDGNIFMGRMLHILPGQEKREDGSVAENQPGLSQFQRNLNAERQKASGKPKNSWNALFIGADAIASTLAGKLDVEKSDFIAGDSENSGAVRMALAETRLINEVRSFLTENGVVLESFNNLNTVRSKTVIIVKNLPASIDEKRLREMFEKCGKVKRFVLPPACKVTALVEMDNQVDAATAFKTLAYKRVGRQPLYLEWAPKDVFNTKPKAEGKSSKAENVKAKKELKVEESGVDEDENDEEAEDEEEEGDEDMEDEEEADEVDESDDEEEIDSDDRPFNYDTDEEEEKKKVAKKKKIEEKKITKKGSVKDVEVEKKSKRAEEKKAKKSADEEVEEKPLKILVRNVPFQATAKELNAIFSAFGELTVCRLPQKMDSNQAGTHRGFAFIQYVSNVDAETAFEALRHSTHLYGRRLVLEWANDDSKEAMKRAKAEFTARERKSKLTKREFQDVMDAYGAPSDDDDL